MFVLMIKFSYAASPEGGEGGGVRGGGRIIMTWRPSYLFRG